MPGRTSRSRLTTTTTTTTTSTKDERRALRTRSSSAKAHSGIVDVAKKLLCTVHKLDLQEGKKRGTRVRRFSDVAIAGAQEEEAFDEEEDMKEEDFLEDVHMEGQTPTVAKTTTRNTVKIHRTPEGTPKDEKQVERVVALMRLILTAKKVKEDKVPALIAPNLYLGSIGAAQSEEQIKEKGITHVLTVARGFEIKHVEGVKYMTVEVADRPDADIRSHFPQCFEFISGAVKSGGNVLVHCFAGRSRSASVCAAYVMCHENIRLDEALMRMRLARPQINPNAGFMGQLNQLDEDLMKWRRKTGQEKMKEDEQEVTSAQSQNRDSGQSKSSTSEGYSMSHGDQHHVTNKRTGVNGGGGENYAETDPASEIAKNTRRAKAGAASTTTESNGTKSTSSDQDNSTPYRNPDKNKNKNLNDNNILEQRPERGGKSAPKPHPPPKTRTTTKASTKGGAMMISSSGSDDDDDHHQQQEQEVVDMDVL
ncbi:unnamed protein product [Bathycoccus prasinos]|jgi:protein-tyrosine phosphatase|tara:strand:- start:544 stop:1980 length:1437 start_codon:yes stop_codon:yes gene_type:complete